jgi:hypothetical protein
VSEDVTDVGQGGGSIKSKNNLVPKIFSALYLNGFTRVREADENHEDHDVPNNNTCHKTNLVEIKLPKKF